MVEPGNGKHVGPRHLRGLRRTATCRSGAVALNFFIGIVVALGCMLGGFAAMGGHLAVIWQPYEMIIIPGSALGTFIVANPLSTIKDTGRAVLEAIKGASPKGRDYLDLLGCSTR